MENAPLASRIKELRTRKGLSQEALAEASGISHRTVQRIENGESKPTGDTLIRLAAALDIAPEELVDWTIKEDKSFLVSLNLAALSFILFPILGILIPFIIWNSGKDKIKHAHQVGAALINFQINWVILFITLPFMLFLGGRMGILDTPTFFIIFMVSMTMYLLNVFFILLNIVRVNTQRKAWYPAIISFLR